MKTYKELYLNGLTLRGYHHQTNSKQCLIMFHGFTGNKTEVGYLFRKLSDRLEELTIDSVRFDYLGSGESDGLFSDMTLPSLKEQARLIIEFTKSHNYEEIYLLGFSMGGALALNMMQGFDKTILLAPSISFFTKHEKIQIPKLENGNYDLNGYELNKDLISSFKKDYFELARKYHNPVLIIQGTNDQAVYYKGSEELSESFTDSTIKLIENAGHTFENREHYKLIDKYVTEFLKK